MEINGWRRSWLQPASSRSECGSERGSSLSRRVVTRFVGATSSAWKPWGSWEEARPSLTSRHVGPAAAATCGRPTHDYALAAQGRLGVLKKMDVVGRLWRRDRASDQAAAGGTVGKKHVEGCRNEIRPRATTGRGAKAHRGRGESHCAFAQIPLATVNGVCCAGGNRIGALGLTDLTASEIGEAAT